MNVDGLLEAVGIPPEARVDRRIPKTMLLEAGKPTAADRRKIQECIEDLRWVAALKPNNIGIPAWQDSEREYVEIAVLTATFRGSVKTARVAELVHRAIPYPVLLLASEPDGTASVSVAHKRFSLNEAGKVVSEQVWRITLRAALPTTEADAAFVASLRLASLPTRDMFSLYHAWVDRVAAHEASKLTGEFLVPRSPVGVVAVAEGLSQHARLAKELATLREEARRQRQLARRVQLNLRIAELLKEMAAIRDGLGGQAVP